MLILSESQAVPQLLLDCVTYAQSASGGPVAREPSLANARRYRYPRSGEHPVRQDAWINVSREMLADTAAPVPLQVSGILDTGLDPHAAVQLKPPFGD